MKKKKNSPVHILVFAAAFLLVYGVFTISNVRQISRSIDPSNAQVSCAAISEHYTIQNPSGFTFSQGCISLGQSIYSDDPRFTFFGYPTPFNNSAFVKTGNINEKEDRNLNWSISLQSQGQIYIMYRKIPSQTVPSWISSQYTKETNDDYTSLSQFIMRKNELGLIGLYDIYRRNSTSPGTVQFGPASDATVTAYSMYMVVIKSVVGAPTPTVTQSPQPTQQTASPTVVPTQTPQITPPPGGTGGNPASVLNLTNWKITLPIGSQGSPTEIKQPALATFKLDPWFVAANGGVRFRAPVTGKTTQNSGYPRSELREMINNGTANAAWSSTVGTHTMTVEEAITALPQTKKHVVSAQIHDGSDDVIVIRLEGPKLFIDIAGNDGPVLDPNYTLGKKFIIKYVVNGGQTKIYYNGSTTPAYTLVKNYSTAFFKAGAYTQSNCSTEGSSGCNENNYGEVIIYNIAVSHQ